MLVKKLIHERKKSRGCVNWHSRPNQYQTNARQSLAP